MLSDAQDNAQLANVAEGPGCLHRQTDDVVLADGHYLHGVGVLVVVCVAVRVMADQLLGSYVTTGHHRLQKLNKFPSVVLATVEEVNTFVDLLYIDALFVGFVLQQQLFEVKEGLLVRRLLAHLYHGLPEVLGLSPVAIVAHHRVDDKLNDKDLLKNGTSVDLLLNRQLHLDPPRVGLCPDESGINEVDAIETLQFFQTQRQQFSGLQLGYHPLADCLLISEEGQVSQH